MTLHDDARQTATGPEPRTEAEQPWTEAERPRSQAYPSSISDPRRKSTALACLLSLVPGLGQVYVGYYRQGFVNILVAGGLITLLATGDLDALTPLAAVFLAFFWLYNVIDAGRRSALYNRALEGGRELELPDDAGLPSTGGSLVGGIALALFGFVLLLNTRFDVSLAWIDEWWPVALILGGLYLAWRAVVERREQRADAGGGSRDLG